MHHPSTVEAANVLFFLFIGWERRRQLQQVRLFVAVASGSGAARSVRSACHEGCKGEDGFPHGDIGSVRPLEPWIEGLTKKKHDFRNLQLAIWSVQWWNSAKSENGTIALVPLENWLFEAMYFTTKHRGLCRFSLIPVLGPKPRYLRSGFSLSLLKNSPTVAALSQMSWLIQITRFSLKI